MEVAEETRHQNGQDFRKVSPDEIHVGQCVWINAYDPNVGRSWLEGPYFVIETIYEGRISEHFVVFSTHMNYATKVKHGNIWVPIIDKIEPPRSHNV